MNQTLVWRRNPFIRILISFILGLLLSNWLENNQRVLTGVFGLGVVALFVFNRGDALNKFKRRLHAGLVIHLLIIIGASMCSNALKPTNRSSYFAGLTASHFIIELDEVSKKKSKWIKCSARVIAARMSDGEIRRCTGRTWVIIQGDGHKLHLGQQILVLNVTSTIDSPNNPYEFDYQSYSATQGVYHQFFLDSQSWSSIGLSNSMHLARKGDEVRETIEIQIDRSFENPDHRSIIRALFLGDRSQLDPTVKQSFVSTGTIHVLAISGMHLGIIYLLIQNFLIPFRKLRFGAWLNFLITALVLAGFAFLTGFSASVNRAAIMFSLFSLGKCLNRNGSSFNNMGFTCVMLLIINPANLSSVSFQFSFIAVSSIVIFFKPIRATIKSKFWLSSKIADLLCVSLVAQLALTPLSLYYFGQFPMYFLLTNLIVVPCITVVMYFGIATLVLSSLGVASGLAATITKSYLWFTVKFTRICEDLPSAIGGDLYLNQFEVLVFYILILSFFLFLAGRGRIYIVFMFVAITTIFGIQTAQDYRERHQQFIQVYRIRDAYVPVLIEGKTSRCITGEQIDSSDFARSIQPSLRHWGIIHEFATTTDTPVIASANGLTVLFLNDKLEIGLIDSTRRQFDYILHPDYGVLSQEAFINSFNQLQSLRTEFQEPNSKRITGESQIELVITKINLRNSEFFLPK